MKPFKFRLERLQKVRSAEERAARAEFAAALGALTRREVALRDALSQRDAARDELRHILDPADLMGPAYPSETFRVLQNNEIKKCGEYRTRRLVLAAYDKLVSEGMRPRVEGYR